MFDASSSVASLKFVSSPLLIRKGRKHMLTWLDIDLIDVVDRVVTESADRKSSLLSDDAEGHPRSKKK